MNNYDKQTTQSPQMHSDSQRQLRIIALRKNISILLISGFIVNFLLLGTRAYFNSINVPVEIIIGIVAAVFVGLIATPLRELHALTTPGQLTDFKPEAKAKGVSLIKKWSLRVITVTLLFCLVHILIANFMPNLLNITQPIVKFAPVILLIALIVLTINNFGKNNAKN